jgi:diguanylate cyclase (GGDEF)-like protein
MVRVLIADDEAKLHDAYRDCFRATREADLAIDDLGAELFGEGGSAAKSDSADFANFAFDHVLQGEEAVTRVSQALADGEPYALVFLDMRMPPGIDGYETARRIRLIDPSVNIAVVTGYSDHTPTKIAEVAGPLDKLYYLSKPFRTADLQQLTRSVSSKWSLERDLLLAHEALSQKITELEHANVRITANEAKTRHMALHDHLTRLPNRLHLVNHLRERLARGERDMAMLMVDLDNFKSVNDMLGHQAGDELVRQIADRLRSSASQAFISRLAGDEFAITMRTSDPGAAEATAQAIIDACAEPLEIMGTTVFVGVSIGIALLGDGDETGSTLMRHADLALYSAKQNGRGRFCWFEAELEELNKLRAQIEKQLRYALANEELRLHYQPIVDPDTGAPYGYEALLRWNNDELGAVPPALFVPVAEQCGLAKQLGEWVIRHAVAEAAKWPDGIVSINVSTHHFQSRDLVGYVSQRAGEVGLPLNRIQFEITETAMFAYPERAARVIADLRAAGIRIALDDFGTGYSSLVNIRDFEIDCIKIDKSFVDDLGGGGQTTAIVNAITAMARLLGLNVVAEGVESDVQVHALRALGCGLMQGFYYAHPMDPSDLPYLNNSRADVIAEDRKAG